LSLRHVVTAMAAVLIICTGLWIYKSYQPVEDCRGLACVDRHEILQSKVMEEISDDELYNAVDVSKLEQALGEGHTSGHSDSTGEMEELE
jgi:hypothetical protein